MRNDLMEKSYIAGPHAWLSRRRRLAQPAVEPARLTLRISAEKAHRLREIAHMRGVSVNTLLDEMASLALFEYELVSAKC